MKVQLILATAEAAITTALTTMLRTIRNYSVVHSVVNGPYIANPVAGFTYEAAVANPLAIEFTNTSTNAVSYSWDFGDNSPESFTPNPIHTYAAAGTYTVSLAVENITGADNTKTENITV